MSSILSTAKLARASARRPWLVVAAWVVVFVLSGLAAATMLGGALTSDVTMTNNPESLRGVDLLAERMPEQTDPIAETVIVRSETATVDDPAFRAVVEAATADLRAVPGVTLFNHYEAAAAGDPAAASLVSADRHATLLPAAFAGSQEAAAGRFEAFSEALAAHRGDGYQVLTVGNLSVDEAFNSTAESDLLTAEIIGLPVALVILVAVFGALVVAGVPLVLAFVSIAVAIGLTALLAQVIEISFFVVNMITMIGLAVGIDYALFIVDRYREERRRGVPTREAIGIAGDTASRAVLFSGITVVLALTGMLLIPTTIFRSLGLGAVLVVVVAVLASLTLVPAMLSLLGDRIDWPRRRRAVVAPAVAAEDHEGPVYRPGFWGRTSHLVMTHPAVSLIGAVAILVAFSLPYFDLRSGQAGVESLPASDVKTAFTILDRDFGAGRLGPVEIVVDGRRGAEVEAGLERLITAIRQDGDFAQVNPPVWNGAGDLALVTASLRMSATTAGAYDAIDRLRDEVVPAAFGDAPAEALVTGETAFNADFLAVVDGWTPIVFAFVLGLSFLLLLLVFRSVVIPATAIALNLLSVGAAYGLMVLVFQRGVGADLLGFQTTPTIEAWVPIFLFCVLFGLSMDYHVFLLSRIKEHYDLTGRNAESVAVGLQATARLITGAALIMIAVFVGFALGELAMFQQVGFGLAVAVFLDATLIRSVLVPAAMALLGRWNWYLPAWLGWLPDLGVEGPRASSGASSVSAAAPFHPFPAPDGAAD